MTTDIQGAETEARSSLPSSAPAPTYEQVTLKWHAAQMQLDESHEDYLSVKKTGRSEVVFTAALVLAEAYCLEREAFQVHEDMVLEELQNQVRTEKLATS